MTQQTDTRLNLRPVIENPTFNTEEYWRNTETIVARQLGSEAIPLAVGEDKTNYELNYETVSAGRPSLLAERQNDRDITSSQALMLGREAYKALGPLNRAHELQDWLIQSVPVALRKARHGADVEMATDFLITGYMNSLRKHIYDERIFDKKTQEVNVISSMIQEAGVLRMSRATELEDYRDASDLFDLANATRGMLKDIGGSETTSRRFEVRKHELDTKALQIHADYLAGDLSIVRAREIFSYIQLENIDTFKLALDKKSGDYGQHFEWLLVLLHNLHVHAEDRFGEAYSRISMPNQDNPSIRMTGESPHRRQSVDVIIHDNESITFLQCKLQDKDKRELEERKREFKKRNKKLKHKDLEEENYGYQYTKFERGYVEPIVIVTSEDATGKDLRPKEAKKKSTDKRSKRDFKRAELKKPYIEHFHTTAEILEKYYKEESDKGYVFELNRTNSMLDSLDWVRAS